MMFAQELSKAIEGYKRILPTMQKSRYNDSASPGRLFCITTARCQ